MTTTLITGANKGLGLEFVRQLSGSGWRVRACCRTPSEATELKDLATKSEGRISVHALDVGDFVSIDRLATELADEPIDLLINNAGIIDTVPTSFSEGARSTLQALGHINYDGWSEVFRVNVIGSMRVTEALLENVAMSECKTIVMISSVMGSITACDPDNFPPGGGVYVYRSSKAALNMVARNLAADLKKRDMRVLSLNPGWVKTKMGGEGGMYTPETSVSNMIGVINASTMGDSGSFISHDGARLPW